MESMTRKISPDEDGMTVRQVMRKKLYFSARAVRRVCRTETGILLNGERVYTDRIVRAGDLLRVEIGDQRQPKGNITPGDWKLNILWEDEYLMMIDKPSGMTAHASNFLPDTPTVAGALAWTRGTDFIFHPVNRLDKGTTGIMIVAKSGYIHEILRKWHHTGRFYREYRAICVGVPDPPEGEINAPIGRDENSTIARMIRPDGAEAVTRYQVLNSFELSGDFNPNSPGLSGDFNSPGLSNGKYSFLKLTPVKGRTHQLRVHMAYLNCPLLGDWLYGVETPDLIGRPALHSYFLRVTHPVTGKILELTAPLPDDMAGLLPDRIENEKT